MTTSSTILYVTHYSPDEYVYQDMARYLQRFPDVEIQSAAKYADEGLPPFATSVNEVTAEAMMEHFAVYDAMFVTAAQEAERAGYGALVGPSQGDPGVSSAQGKISIPFIGMGWANFTTAQRVGGKFSVLHNHLHDTMQFIEMQARGYGFGDDLVSVEPFDADPYAWSAKQEKPDFNALVDLTLPAVQRCVDKGAKALMIACGSSEMSEFAHTLSAVTINEFGVPVLAPVDTAIDRARESIERANGTLSR